MRRVELVVLNILFFLTGLIMVGTANAGTIYTVSPNQGVGAALTRLRAGDTLIFQDGTYNEAVNVSMSPGTSQQPITVKAAPGAHPVISGLFWIGNPTWTTFDGINVTWGPQSGGSGNHMVKFKGGSHWTITNAEFWGAQSYANILVTNGSAAPNDWTIQNSCIHDAWTGHGSNQDHNIYVTDIHGSVGGLITGNTLFNALGGRNIKLGPGSGSGGPTNVTIRGNALWNASQGISLSYGTANTLIENNTIAKTTGGDLIDPNSLTGTGNAAKDNVGWESKTGKFIGDSTVKDLGGNVFVSPRFSSLKCPTPQPTPSPSPSLFTPSPVITPSLTPIPSASGCVSP